MKTLGNSDSSGTRVNVPDVQFWGNGDTWQLICKASSESEGWMKSTKAMEIPKLGCLVQVTTQQRNPDGSYAVAESIAFVPGVVIATEQGTGTGPVARHILPMGLVESFVDELEKSVPVLEKVPGAHFGDPNPL